ncbi:MAG: complement resistance protein TraT [Minisyncoccia bacterium]|jgi:hypothetical protein
MKNRKEGRPALCYAVFGLALLAAATCLSGCAATEVALEHKDLKVSTQMSSTIFLDVENRTARTVYLDVRNTSDKDIDVRPLIESRLVAQGYTVTPNAKEAFYILQMNILQVGVADPSAAHESLYAGWGGQLAGGVAGAMIGGNRTSNSFGGAMNGAGIGGLVGGAGELIAGALVKNVTYSIITDLQILERTDEAVKQTVQSDLAQGTGTRVLQTSESTQGRKKYQTRILSTANQVNLKFEQALPILEEQLAKSVAGLL